MSDTKDKTTEAVKSGGIDTTDFNFGPWTVSVKKSHILPSKCASPETCSMLKEDVNIKTEYCPFCRFENELQLPQLPDMTFASNSLQVLHEEGFGIEFNCLDALRPVNNNTDLMKVAVAEAWQQARSGSEHIRDVIKPFDWTFTTDYKGTLLVNKIKSLKVTETSERIDMEKLKVREKIMFYEDLHLFEDELADNGCAQCSVKMRIMESSFFILFRYYLRVDNVIVRINDTRIYHEADKNYILREFTTRESKACDLKIPTSMVTDPVEVWQHLPIKVFCYEKLTFPS